MTLLNCQSNVFWPCVAIIIAPFEKNTEAIETAVISDCMHDGDLEHCLMEERK